MKKWKFIIALILATTIFLSVGCISALAVNLDPTGSNSWQPSNGWAPNNPAPSNSDQYYDDGEDEVSYTIIATAHKGGSISPKGAVEVWEYDDQSFEITPKSKYEIEKVLVDGKNIGPVNYYEFVDVDRDHTIEVFFRTLATTENTKSDDEFNPNTGAC